MASQTLKYSLESLIVLASYVQMQQQMWRSFRMPPTRIKQDGDAGQILLVTATALFEPSGGGLDRRRSRDRPGQVDCWLIAVGRRRLLLVPQQSLSLHQPVSVFERSSLCSEGPGMVYILHA